ncbi:MAG: glycoside hydrolase family 127 protein [Lachnospiraceae bacterium]|nr:glycoside hydrolase family 127 protein [Lachnospiraceae bacterium]
MGDLYSKNTANYPRLFTDKFFVDYKNTAAYNGFIDTAIRYIEDFQLLRTDLWARFVQQFKQEDADYEGGWRGEYWGKMMRGACFTYSYTQNPRLYKVLTDTVLDMMEAQEENGRISSYGAYHEFWAWDIWARKYVLLGMQYFLEICTDEELTKKIIKSMCGQVDYIMTKIGDPQEGKKLITTATCNWRGLNSSSLLEPMVRLYSLTKEQKYLDFATYIVNCGGTEVINIFDLAYEDKFYPYQYPITKAYEMMSCFEGLLEYYRVTGIEKHKVSVINFANKILESDFTIIGSCGCTHELFDHSTVRQANTTNGAIAQETCVTVTLMKFFYQLTLLTGDVRYSDAFETSLYNAFLGAVNTDKVIEPTIKQNHPDWSIEPLPFDSYSPLTAGTRGNGIGGLKLMSDNHYYGCCACIGAAGTGLISKMALLTSGKGFVMNLFIDGSMKTTTQSGSEVTFHTHTGYPVDGNVKITVELQKKERFELLIRNPQWSKNTKLFINGVEQKVESGYLAVDREWSDGDVIELELDMRTQAIYPIPYGHEIIMNKVVWKINYMVPTYDEEDPIAKNHIALRRGPVILAQENRLGYSVDDPVKVLVDEDGYVDVTMPEKEIAPYEHILEVEVPLADGRKMHVTDYASAGKLWTEESKMAAWMLTE